MTDIIVLGGGMVGQVMARDLAKEDGFNVTVADMNPDLMDQLKQYGISFFRADLSSEKAVTDLIEDFDFVIGAVPGSMGFKTLETVIKAGKDICDIAFMPENPLKLDQLAKENGVTAVVDCGVAPGMSNMITGYVNALFEKLTDVTIMVGGLPVVRKWPFEYKAPFSPIDVVEEYTRPARYVKNGEIVTMPALSEPELVNFPEIGTLEAFNTDGLRSIMDTIECPNMKEKTLRYPGHIEIMRILREMGLFSEKPIMVDGVPTEPRSLTTKLLFPMWKLEPGEKEFTIMRVIVDGLNGGVKMRYTFDLLDYFDEETGFSSMSRTTGFPCTIVARQMIKGRYKNPGVNPPEYLGKDKELFRLVMDELVERGVNFTVKTETL